MTLRKDVYKRQPQNIAEAIKSINLNDDYNGREIIEELNKEFKENIWELLK